MQEGVNKMAVTVKNAVLQAVSRLSEAGIPGPKLDAEVLLCHLLNKERTYLIVNAAKKLEDAFVDSYMSLVEQRAQGKPIPYITGKKEFMGISLKVNPHVLIPRADTETMVENAIESLSEGKYGIGGPSVLDLCCGSGAIGISMACLIPRIKVTATDISAPALALAEENAKSNKVKKKMKFLQGDLFQAVKEKSRFDLIITNPPYIKTDTITQLQREIQNYEPRLALDGGEDGLAFYRRIVPEAAAHLKKKGLLYMEIGYDQGQAVKALLETSELYREIEILQDLAGFDRMVKARRA